MWLCPCLRRSRPLLDFITNGPHLFEKLRYIAIRSSAVGLHRSAGSALVDGPNRDMTIRFSGH